MLPLESLHVFVVAAELENFSRAARRLHLSQPAVSQHIQALEKRLGVQLFERNGRRVRLSAAGETLLPLARDLIRASKQLEEVAFTLSGEVVGHLIVGCSTTSGKYVLPPLLAKFRRRYPLVKGTVRVGMRNQVIDWLQAGEVDLAITSERINRSGIHYRQFFEDEIVLIVPKGHPWAEKGTIPPEALYEEQFIMREPVSGTYMAVVEALDEVGIDVERLERVLTLGNSEAIIMAVEEGIGLGFVPRVAAERCLALGRIAVVQLEGVNMRRWLYIAYNGMRAKTPALNAFCEFMEELDPAYTCADPQLLLHYLKMK